MWISKYERYTRYRWIQCQEVPFTYTLLLEINCAKNSYRKGLYLNDTSGCSDTIISEAFIAKHSVNGPFHLLHAGCAKHYKKWDHWRPWLLSQKTNSELNNSILFFFIQFWISPTIHLRRGHRGAHFLQGTVHEKLISLSFPERCRLRTTK